MKYIREKFLDFLSPSWRERFVFAEVREYADALPEGPEKVKDLIDFRYKHVDEMDRSLGKGEKDAEGKDAIEQICGSHEHFQILVEHQLRLVETLSSIEALFPPRILYGIYVSKHLQSFLTREQVARIKKFYEEEQKKALEDLKKAEEEEPSQKKILRWVAMYEALKLEDRNPKYDLLAAKAEEQAHAKAKGENVKDKVKVPEKDHLLKLLRNRLLRAGVTMLTRARVSETMGADTLPLSEKLQILEIYRVLPDAKDWDITQGQMRRMDDGKNGENASILLKKMAGFVLENVAERSDREELSFFWDTIDDLAQKEGRDPLMSSGNETLKERIRERVRRVNAARFVAWSAGKRMLLPEEVVQLQKLAYGEGKLSTKKESDLEKLREELQEMRTNRESLRSQKEALDQKISALHLDKFLEEEGEQIFEGMDIVEEDKTSLLDVRKRILDGNEGMANLEKELRDFIDGVGDNSRFLIQVQSAKQKLLKEFGEKASTSTPVSPETYDQFKSALSGNGNDRLISYFDVLRQKEVDCKKQRQVAESEFKRYIRQLSDEKKLVDTNIASLDADIEEVTHKEAELAGDLVVEEFEPREFKKYLEGDNADLESFDDSRTELVALQTELDKQIADKNVLDDEFLDETKGKKRIQKLELEDAKAKKLEELRAEWQHNTAKRNKAFEEFEEKIERLSDPFEDELGSGIKLFLAELKNAKKARRNMTDLHYSDFLKLIEEKSSSEVDMTLLKESVIAFRSVDHPNGELHHAMAKSESKFWDYMGKVKEEVARKRTQVDGEIEKIKSKLAGKKQEARTGANVADYMEHVHAKARESVGAYRTEVNVRFLGHALLQEDFDLLMRTEGANTRFRLHDDDAEAATEFMDEAIGEEKVKALRKVRERILTVLNTRIDEKIKGQFASDDIKDWEAKVQEAFRVEDVLAGIEGGENFLEELEDLGCIPSEIIDGAVMYFREKIEKVIETELKENTTVGEDKKREFIANIRRLHSPLRSAGETNTIIDRLKGIRERTKDRMNLILEKEHQEVITLAENNARKEITKIANDKKYDKGFGKPGELVNVTVENILRVEDEGKINELIPGVSNNRDREKIHAAWRRMRALQESVKKGAEAIRGGYIVEKMEERKMEPGQLRGILSAQLAGYPLSTGKPEDIARDLSSDSNDIDDFEMERISDQLRETYFDQKHFHEGESAEKLSGLQSKEDIAAYCRSSILPVAVAVRQVRQEVIDGNYNDWCSEQLQRRRTEMLTELVQKCEGKEQAEVERIVYDFTQAHLENISLSAWSKARGSREGRVMETGFTTDLSKGFTVDPRDLEMVRQNLGRSFCTHINERNNKIQEITDAILRQKEENARLTQQYIPGTEELYTLEREALPYHEKAGRTLSDFEKRISQIQSEISKHEGAVPKGETREKMEELFTLWEGGRQEVQSQIDNLEEVFDRVFPDDSPKYAEQKKAMKEKFLKKIKELWDTPNESGEAKHVCGEFQCLYDRFKNPKEGFQSSDFSLLVSRMSHLREVINVNGTTPWRKDQERRIVEHIDFEVNTMTLKELGADKEPPEGGLQGVEAQIYDEDGMNLAKAKENFEEKRGKFNEHFVKYKDTMRLISRRISRDIDDLSEPDFASRYKQSKDAIRNFLAKLQSSDVEFDDLWDKFNKTDSKTDKPQFWAEFENTWTESLGEDGDPMKKAEAMNMLTGWQDIVAHAKAVEECTHKFSHWIEEYDENEQENFSTLFSPGSRLHMRARKREWGVEWISLYTFYDVIKKTLESRDRLWKRKMDHATAKFGEAIFGDTRVGKEFFRMGEHSEDERIEEYKSQYHYQPFTRLEEIMEKSHDRDEVRAIIGLLNDRGQLSWDNPVLWRALMNIGHGVHFSIPGDMDKDYGEMRNKVQEAVTRIWSYEVFRAWDTALDGNATKAQSSFFGEFDGFETTDKNARTQILADMLKRWSRGEMDTGNKVKAGGIDPARYEAFISRAIENGKMNGQPDQRWYFIAMGLGTVNPRNGRPLLSRASLARLNAKFLGTFPDVDFFVDNRSWKLNGMIVPEGTPGAKKDLWNFQDYQAWAQFLGDGGGTYDPRSGQTAENTKRFFYEIVCLSETANDRNHRMMKKADTFDHDDAQTWGCRWTYREVCNMLGRESNSKEKSSVDFWRTFLSGFDMQLRYTHDLIRRRDQDPLFKSNPHWKTQRDGMLKGIGNSLRSNITVLQAVFGNYVTYADQNRATVYGDEELKKKETAYSPAISKSREKINGFARLVFAQGGGKFDDILDYEGYHHGKSTNELDKNAEWKLMSQRAAQLVSDETADNFFRNPENIEKALREYCGG